jgi:hypothetical protein
MDSAHLLCHKPMIVCSSGGAATAMLTCHLIWWLLGTMWAWTIPPNVVGATMFCLYRSVCCKIALLCCSLNFFIVLVLQEASQATAVPGIDSERAAALLPADRTRLLELCVLSYLVLIKARKVAQWVSSPIVFFMRVNIVLFLFHSLHLSLLAECMYGSFLTNHRDAQRFNRMSASPGGCTVQYSKEACLRATSLVMPAKFCQ